MEIYILRHGEAQPRDEGVPEPDRKLTPKGKRDVDRVARLALAAKVNPGLVLSSPYRRASETAQIAAKVLGIKRQIVESSALLPQAHPKQVWKEVRSQSSAKELLLVGHEPQLSGLIAYFLAAPDLRIDLKKSALVSIRIDQLGPEPHGELKWVLTPGLVRACRSLYLK